MLFRVIYKSRLAMFWLEPMSWFFQKRKRSIVWQYKVRFKPGTNSTSTLNIMNINSQNIVCFSTFKNISIPALPIFPMENMNFRSHTYIFWTYYQNIITRQTSFPFIRKVFVILKHQICKVQCICSIRRSKNLEGRSIPAEVGTLQNR